MEAIITNIILVAVLLAVVGIAVFYIIKSKKSGKKCIGCPDSGSCSSKENSACSGCCSCCSVCSSATQHTNNQ